ncbi:phospholipase [Aliidongia dinghuensis]|uniref:Phospholipase D n=1 Tax=Aliidongia dinghuensis TaxID=1867774 RepID=A0A8J3E2A3_9PROT|nr:phosphatidylserine/phosphatidylglycerophosphate/cardiolipin synthase family protein [Aliidongia dinghuensis]GGF09326.1 phospholipase [Aliidongia dinghuensis]
MNEATLGEPAAYIPAATACSYPVRDGNLIRPLVDGVPAFTRIGAAVEAARHSVWLTVTFMAPEVELPQGRGTLFDLLDRAVARGVDVRVLFWRPNPETEHYGRTFAGRPEDRALLAARGSRFRIRWDRSPTTYCQHQKSWLIDAGHDTELAFVGGININHRALGTRDHADMSRIHDAYVELAGPSATDVHHNFVQRWNEASECWAPDGTWGHTALDYPGSDALEFPSCTSAGRGTSRVQVQRTISPGCYGDGHAAPGAPPFDIAAGERSILEQYTRAIEAARRSIYIENQAIPIAEIAARLEAALARGVAVTALVPGVPEDWVTLARRAGQRREQFDRLAALGRYEGFTLAGLAGRAGLGPRHDIYVHDKLMLVDDAWATIGSANLHHNSLYGSGEMNVSVWDPAFTRALRIDLLDEHLGRDTSALDDSAALKLYQQIARENRRKHAAGDPDWQGHAFALDPATYGM